MLTDGNIKNRNDVINQIKEQQESNKADCKVFAFGVGDDVDKILVKDCAAAGNGLPYFAEDA